MADASRLLCANAGSSYDVVAHVILKAVTEADSTFQLFCVTRGSQHRTTFRPDAVLEHGTVIARSRHAAAP